MILPRRVEVLHPIMPWSNFLIIGICVLCFGGWFTGLSSFFEYFILDSWNPLELLFSSLLHAGFFHLLFNMLYLWVFGNAICSKFGNIKFLLLYFGGALFSGAAHMLFDSGAAVGASGSINAIIGFFLVIYPTNRIHCLYWLFIYAGSFSLKAFWLIGFWFLSDVWGAFRGSGSDIAFWAHIGGLCFGALVGYISLKKDWIEMSVHDNETLLDLMDKKAHNRL